MQGVDAIDNKLNGLKRFQRNADKLAVDGLMEEEAIVLDMNFEEQLYLEGVNSYNVPIMDYKPYSPTTVFIKEQKNQPVNRVTLKDEGDFYGGAELKRISSTAAEIISTDPKSESLQDKYGKEILGLKPDNMNELNEYYIKPYLINKLNKV